MNPGHAASDRLDVLDGMRGIAILLVVWYHAWQIAWLSTPYFHLFGHEFTLQVIPETGWLGVELFFFLSGFCLFLPYARAALEGTKEPTLRHFIDRRVAKIVPSYLLAIIVLTLAGFAHWDSFTSAFRDIAFHLLFIHNWFGVTYGSIDGPMWSLATEVQFYVLFPLLAWIFRRRPFVSWVILCVIALAWRLAAVHQGTYWLADMLNQMPSVLDLFASGMLAAWIVPLLRTRAARLADNRSLWTVIALGACIAAWMLAASAYAAKGDPFWSEHWKVWHRPLLAITLAVLTVGSSFSVPLWHRVLANRVFVWLAAISYNLYIWHVPILRWWVGRGIIPDFAQLHESSHAGLIYYLLAVSSALAVATALTYGFERPIMRIRTFSVFRRAGTAALEQ